MNKPNYCDWCGTKITSPKNKHCGECGADLSLIPIYSPDSLNIKPVDNFKAMVKELGSKLEKITNNPNLNEKQKIDRILHTTGATCGIVALQPIPVADIFILTPVQCAMVIYIGKIKGQNINFDRANEILLEIAAVVGAGLLAQHAVILGYKLFIPYAGGLFTIPIVWAVTYGIGRAASAYYDVKKENPGKKLSEEDKKKIQGEYDKGCKDAPKDNGAKGGKDGIKG